MKDVFFFCWQRFICLQRFVWKPSNKFGVPNSKQTYLKLSEDVKQIHSCLSNLSKVLIDSGSAWYSDASPPLVLVLSIHILWQTVSTSTSKRYKCDSPQSMLFVFRSYCTFLKSLDLLHRSVSVLPKKWKWLANSFLNFKQLNWLWNNSSTSYEFFHPGNVLRGNTAQRRLLWMVSGGSWSCGDGQVSNLSNHGSKWGQSMAIDVVCLFLFVL